jgi:hypothetical protein
MCMNEYAYRHAFINKYLYLFNGYNFTYIYAYVYTEVSVFIHTV